MHTPNPLPSELTDRPFSVAEGLSLGLSEKDLRSPQLDSPFVGVRATKAPTTIEDRARAYAQKMHEAAFFSHSTAAVLHDLWLPRHVEQDLALHVAVPPGVRAPRDRQVKGHTLVERPGLVRDKNGLRVASPLEAWCQLATILGMLDLIVAGESLMAKNRPGRLPRWALVRAVQAGDRPRQALLQRVLPELRKGVRSAMETRLRRLIVDGGLPEPDVNVDVFEQAGVWLAECDLVYRVQRVIVEYEGRQHFLTELAQRNDVLKYERLADLGWRVVRVTKDDYNLRPEETLHRIRNALARA